MVNIIENSTIGSEEDSLARIVPTWIKGYFSVGCLRFGRTEYRITRKNFFFFPKDWRESIVCRKKNRGYPVFS